MAARRIWGPKEIGHSFKLSRKLGLASGKADDFAGLVIAEFGCVVQEQGQAKSLNGLHGRSALPNRKKGVLHESLGKATSNRPGSGHERHPFRLRFFSPSCA